MLPFPLSIITPLRYTLSFLRFEISRVATVGLEIIGSVTDTCSLYATPFEFTA